MVQTCPFLCDLRACPPVLGRTWRPSRWWRPRRRSPCCDRPGSPCSLAERGSPCSPEPRPAGEAFTADPSMMATGFRGAPFSRGPRRSAVPAGPPGGPVSLERFHTCLSSGNPRSTCNTLKQKPVIYSSAVSSVTVSPRPLPQLPEFSETWFPPCEVSTVACWHVCDSRRPRARWTRGPDSWRLPVSVA